MLDVRCKVEVDCGIEEVQFPVRKSLTVVKSYSRKTIRLCHRSIIARQCPKPQRGKSISMGQRPMAMVGPDNISPEGAQARISRTICTAVGKAVASKDLHHAQDQVIISTQNWKAGSYICRLNYKDSSSKTIKFTIVK